MLSMYRENKLISNLDLILKMNSFLVLEWAWSLKVRGRNSSPQYLDSANFGDDFSGFSEGILGLDDSEVRGMSLGEKATLV